MGFKKIVKKGVFSGISPTRWLGMEQIKGNIQAIGAMANGLFKVKERIVRKETFEQCMQRYGLGEADLKKRMRATLRLVWCCLGFSLLMLAYTIYLFVCHLALSGFVTLILTILLWAYAFREHFNYFQMKRRRLGCTFKDWLDGTLKGVNKGAVKRKDITH